jgi:hypothetical protein
MYGYVLSAPNVRGKQRSSSGSNARAARARGGEHA